MTRHISFGAQSALKRYKAWTGKAIDKLLALRDVDRMGWPEIADDLGYTVEQCVRRYQIVKGFRSRGLRRKNQGIQKADERAVADRDVRNNAIRARAEESERSGYLTSIINGDPPKGYSALDRRKVNA